MNLEFISQIFTTHKNTMTKNNTWMMLTYYCPTHGSLERSEPLEITRNDLRNAKLKFYKNKKLNKLT